MFTLDKEPVEGFKITPEHKAFHRVFQKFNATQQLIKRGLVATVQKLQGLQQLAKEVEGKKRELLLRAPNQSVYEAEDEGMRRKPQEEGMMGPEQMMEGEVQ